MTNHFTEYPDGIAYYNVITHVLKVININLKSQFLKELRLKSPQTVGTTYLNLCDQFASLSRDKSEFGCIYNWRSIAFNILMDIRLP
jgi:hypothetical protein